MEIMENFINYQLKKSKEKYKVVKLIKLIDIIEENNLIKSWRIIDELCI